MALSFGISIPVSSSIPRLIKDINQLQKAGSRAINQIQRDAKANSEVSKVLAKNSFKNTTLAIKNIQLVREAFRDAQKEIAARVAKGGPGVLGKLTPEMAVQETFNELINKELATREAIIVAKKAGMNEDQAALAILEKRDTLVNETLALSFDNTKVGREAILNQQILNLKINETVAQRRVILELEKKRAELIFAGGNIRETLKAGSTGKPTAASDFAALERLGALDRLAKAKKVTIQVAAAEADAEGMSTEAILANADAIKTATAAANARRTALVSLARARGTSLATVTAEANATNMSTEAIKANAEATMLAANAKRRLRAELIGASIGMFVFGITITQTISGLAAMVSSGKEAAKTVTFLSNVVKAALGPIQVMMGILQFWNIQNIQLSTTNAAVAESNAEVAASNAVVAESSFFAATGVIALRTSLLSIVGILGTIVLVVAAFRTESKGLRAVLLGMATTVGILTSAFIALRAAEIAQTIATIIAEMVLSSGSAAPIIAASIAGAAILAGIAVGVASYSFDTGFGDFKKVGRTGMALVHEGEMVTQTATIAEKGNINKLGLGGGGQVINISVRGDLDTNANRRLLRKFDSMQIGSLSSAGGF